MAKYKVTQKVDANGTTADMIISAECIEKDTSVIQNSTKPITSGAVYTALSNLPSGGVTDVQVDGTSVVSGGVASIDLTTKMDKANPTGTGSLSLNRKANTTTGTNSSTIGYQNTAEGNYSCATGYQTEAIGLYSHTEGYKTTARGDRGHAEGYQTKASGANSHAEGYGTTASSTNQHVFGRNNQSDTDNTYIEIVGNGDTSLGTLSNARTLDWSGNEYLAGNIKVNKTTLTNQASSDISVNLPSSAGTLALTSDIPAVPEKYNTSGSSKYIGYNTEENANSEYNLVFKGNNDLNGICWSKFANMTTTTKSPSACTNNGFFYVSSSTASLSGADSNPFLAAGLHTSQNDFRILTTAYSDQWLQQIATDFRSEYVFVRRRENGTWKDWVKVAPIDTSSFMPKSGGTFTGAVNFPSASIDGNGYVTGTWLRTTNATEFSSGWSDVFVNNGGWLYKRSKANFISDLGIAGGKLDFKYSVPLDNNNKAYAVKFLSFDKSQITNWSSSPNTFSIRLSHKNMYASSAFDEIVTCAYYNGSFTSGQVTKNYGGSTPSQSSCEVASMYGHSTGDVFVVINGDIIDYYVFVYTSSAFTGVLEISDIDYLPPGAIVTISSTLTKYSSGTINWLTDQGLIIKTNTIASKVSSTLKLEFVGRYTTATVPSGAIGNNYVVFPAAPYSYYGGTFAYTGTDANNLTNIYSGSAPYCYYKDTRYTKYRKQDNTTAQIANANFWVIGSVYKVLS